MSCYLIHILYSILFVSFYMYRGRVRSPGVMHMLYSIMPSRSILIHISQVYILTSSDVPHQSLGSASAFVPVNYVYPRSCILIDSLFTFHTTSLILYICHSIYTMWGSNHVCCMLFLSFLLCFYIFLFFVYLQGVLITFLCMYRLGFLCLFKVGLDRISLSL